MGGCFDEFVVSDEFIGQELKAPYSDRSISLSVISAINDFETCAEILKMFPDFDTICVGHKMTYQCDQMRIMKKQLGKK